MEPRLVPGAKQDREQGAIAVEFAVASLIWVTAVLVLAAVYQLSTSRDDLADAAGQAARAASMTSQPADAIQAATTLAHQRLNTGACDPATVRVLVDVSDFRPTGDVSVTVSCRTRSRIGTRRILTDTADEVIDTYRGGT